MAQWIWLDLRGRHSSLVAFLALVALLALPVSAQDEDLSSPKLRIEWTEFKKQYDAKAVQVVDVRGENAYAAGHIPGARSIPLAEIERGRAELIDGLKKLKQPIVLYCA